MWNIDYIDIARIVSHLLASRLPLSYRRAFSEVKFNWDPKINTRLMGIWTERPMNLNQKIDEFEPKESMEGKTYSTSRTIFQISRGNKKNETGKETCSKANQRQMRKIETARDWKKLAGWFLGFLIDWPFPSMRSVCVDAEWMLRLTAYNAHRN